jgi:diphthamide biosynthesis protein 2
VYDWLVADLEVRLGSAGSEELELYIAADSTYGSSVDDISAEHVDSDVLVYFGSDLSSSGAMPVMVVPQAVPVDIPTCAALVTQEVLAWGSDSSSSNSRVVVVYEPGCQASVPALCAELRAALPQLEVVCGQLPCCADLALWTPDLVAINDTAANAGTVRVGGLAVSSAALGDPDSTIVVYVGDKAEQLDAVALHMGQHAMVAYSNATGSCVRMRGDETKAFRERFGGVSKVEQARVIGIIVGSMGLTGASTKGIITRLQRLCEAGGRKTYCFIMGRLNEAKLCNFPEVDVFCLVSNEDTAVIAPKSFPVPVITPWELELGLGARDWGSCYMASPTAIFGTGDYASSGGDGVGGGEDEDDDPMLLAAIEKVMEAKDANCYLQDSSSDDDDEGGNVGGTGLSGGEAFVPDANDNGEISTRNGDGGDDDDDGEAASVPSSALVSTDKREGRVIKFESAAADFFSSRQWQGLRPDLSEDESASLEIQKGLSGIAADYKKK